MWPTSAARGCATIGRPCSRAVVALIVWLPFGVFSDRLQVCRGSLVGVAARDGTRAPTRTQGPESMTEKRVVVIEDDAFHAELHAQVLEQAGVHAVLVSDSPSLAELTRQVRVVAPDVILVDEMLTGWGMLGHEVVEHLQRELPAMPVVVVLTVAASSCGESYRALGIPLRNIHAKPCSAGELVQYVVTALDDARAHAAYLNGQQNESSPRGEAREARE